MAKEFNNGMDQAMSAATRSLEALKESTVKLAARELERMNTKFAPGRRQQFSHDTCGRTQSVLPRSGQAEHTRGGTRWRST